MHTSASAHTELPGSNEHMSLRLKAVWQQVFKICNRKATLSGGGCQRGRRGALGGRETDKRERAGKETGCVGDKRERRGRRAGRPPPTLGGFGPNWLVGGASALGSAGRHAGTRVYVLTHIYRHASTCVYMRGCGVSLLLGSSTTGGNRMLCSWAQENHRNTWSSERKGDFRHRHGQTGHLDEDSPTSGSSPGRGDA